MTNRRRTLLLLALPALLISCSSLTKRGGGPATRPSFGALSPKADVPPPAWITKPPQSQQYRYVVGEAVGVEDKEQALEQAWVSAFVRLGMAEFPELSSVSSESVETLHGVSHERRFVLNLERVNWAGMREVTEYGSPYIEWDTDTGRYKVYRLLRWGHSDMEAARKQIAATQVHRLPVRPEAARRRERELVEAVKEIQAINERVASREALYDRVFKEIKCGVTVADLIRVLGSPDRYNPYNRYIVEKEYYWGNYLVERVGADPTVVAITRTDDRSGRRIVCRASADDAEAAKKRLGSNDPTASRS